MTTTIDKLHAARLHLTSDEHHSTDAVGFSRFALLGTPDEPTPAKYYQWQPQEPTDAMVVGTLTHMMEYEPEKVRATVAVRPVDASNRLVAINTNDYKEWAAEHTGKLIVSPAMFEQAASVIGVLHASRMYRKWRAETRIIMTEASFEWTDEATGIRCKIRPDALVELPDGRICNEDLKTCLDPSPTEFSRDIRTRGYLRRMAWYRMGLRAITGEDTAQVLLAVGKEHHTAAIYQASDLDAAESINREMLEYLASGAQKAAWEGDINFI